MDKSICEKRIRIVVGHASVPICLQVNSAAHTKAAISDLAPKAWAGYSGAAFPAQMMRHASAFAAPTSCIGDAAMPYSVAEAAKAIGKRKATVLRAIVSGKISATRDEAGAFQVEPAEIHRVFPPAAPHDAPHDAVNAASRINDASGELRELRSRLEAIEDGIRVRDETIADLRHRLDDESAERRRLTAVLADQRAAAPPSAPKPPRTAWRRVLQVLGHTR